MTKQTTVELLVLKQEKKSQSELQIVLNQVIEEAQELYPKKTKRFSSDRNFNRNFRRTYSSAKTDLTHSQWHYILSRALERIGDKINADGRFTDEVIFSDAYALFVHQVIVAYGTTFGTGYALKELNKKCSWLNKDSEGILVANEAVMRLLRTDTESQKGGCEMLASVAIKKQHSPAQITVCFKLGIQQYISNQYQKHEVNFSKINPLGTVPIDESKKPYEKRKVLTVQDFVRHDELTNMFEAAIHDLRDAVKNEQEASDYNPEKPSLNEQALAALSHYLDWSNVMIYKNCRTFRSQIAALMSAVDGWTAWRSTTVSNHLIEHFRKHFELTNEVRLILEYKAKSRAVAWRLANAKQERFNHDDTLFVHKVSKRMEPISRLVSHADQELCLMMLKQGISFMPDDCIS